MESQKKFAPAFSFEFFPPQTSEGMEKLRATRRQLAQLNPKFFSVTFGAGGSTRDRTLETVLEIQAEGHVVAPHLSCIGSTSENIRSMLQKYYDAGIRHIVALRGDLPSGMAQAGEFRYANELVTFIHEEFGDTFHIEVAAYPEYHPQAVSPQEDLRNFKRKVDAGADAVITQYFYNADAYFNFIDSCEAIGIDIPIVPGIMPINKFSQLARFSDACGAEVPRWIRKRLEGYDDDTASIRAFGLDIVTDLCDRLLQAGAPGLHFYTLKAGLETLGIEYLVEEKSRLPQLNSVYVPEGIDEKEVRRRLLADYNLEIGAGLGDLAGKIWRFGLMGYSSKTENVMLCLGALETVLSDMGKKIKQGTAEAAAHYAYAANPLPLESKSTAKAA